MPLTLSQITSVVDEIAPFRLAYEWDNVGLQIGDPNQRVDRLLIALEMNEAVLKNAVAEHFDAILVHHPLIFKPLKSIRPDLPKGYLQTELIRRNIGLICAHTNLDRVLRGTNGALAKRAGLDDIKILEPATLDEQFKLTIFVPRDYTEKVIAAIHRGGGGWIGKYSHCTFRAPGTGTYVPESGSHPFQGEQGQLEQAEEDRLETLVSRRALKSVLTEVMEAHPYEEVAYDVFPLYDANPKYGLGAVGVFQEPVTLKELGQRLCDNCNAEFVKIAGPPDKSLRRGAVITGSAGSSIRTITKSIADVVITGELSYHQCQDAVDYGLCVVILGHAASEKIFAGFFRDELKTEQAIMAAGLEIETFDDFPEPYTFVGRK